MVHQTENAISPSGVFGLMYLGWNSLVHLPSLKFF